MGSSSSTLLLSLVEDILNLSKIEGGIFKVSLSDFTLGDLLNDVYEIFSIQSSQKKLKFNMIAKKQVKQMTVHSDCSRLKQVLLNLLSNAFKFTFEGEVSLVVRTVRLEGYPFLQFTVSDTGIGIKHADLGKIYKLFGMQNRIGNG